MRKIGLESSLFMASIAALSATVASAIFEIAMLVQFARLVPTVAGVAVTADTYELSVTAWE